MPFYNKIYTSFKESKYFYGSCVITFTLDSFAYRDLNRALYEGKGGFIGKAKLFKNFSKSLLVSYSHFKANFDILYRGVKS
jgi:hypothetical protein